MCGRYASSRRPEDLISYFEAEDPPEEELTASYNVAPTDPVYVVLKRHQRRQLRVVRWGLVPSWAKDPKLGAKLINARSETLSTTAAFRAAYRRRRCLVPADGYYEWKKEGTAKQPFFLSAFDGAPLAMAGLYEIWAPPDSDGERLWTCTVVTTTAPDEHAEVHDRTPLLVPPEHWATWLDPEVEDPGDLLVAGVVGVLAARPVGKAVGSVRNNSPSLVLPVDPEAAA